MLNGKKIVVVTPAGRKYTLEILFEYIKKEMHIIDEYRLWLNTKNQDEIDYIWQLQQEYPDFVTVDDRFFNYPDYASPKLLNNFFDRCVDKDTIYIRIDDDVIWLQEHFVETLATWRINHPEYFIVFPTILNNSIIDSYVQERGLYPNFPKMRPNVWDLNSWKSPEIAEKKHEYFLNEFLTSQKDFPIVFDHFESNEHISVNVVAWFGEDFAKFNGAVLGNEEAFISTIYPKEHNLKNAVFGGVYCIHYAYFTQLYYLYDKKVHTKYKAFI